MPPPIKDRPMPRRQCKKFTPFPPLFGRVYMTEMLVAFRKLGPLRSAALKKAFGQQVVRSVDIERSNPARLQVAANLGRLSNSPRIIGINPEAMAIPEFRNLLDALGEAYELRHVRPACESELAAFRAVTFPGLNPEGVFGTATRTKLLVALRTLGGRYDKGKLSRTVLGDAHSRVDDVVEALIEEGVLVKNGIVIAFNRDQPWMTELLALLGALALQMPDVAENAKLRKAASYGSEPSHRHGQRFRLIGSRVNQAILAFLATYGPSRIMEIIGHVAAEETRSMEPLLRQGLVCKVYSPAPGGRTYLYSLNSAHPVYAELRALLRTDSVLDDSFPIRPKRSIYDGPDLGDPTVECLPYALFGVSHKAAITNILATLAHTEYRECETGALFRVLRGEHGYATIGRALRQLESKGVVTSRRWKRFLMWRLDPNFGAYKEVLDLLVGIGRAWPEFRDSGRAETKGRSPWRVSMERGRTPAPLSGKK